MTPWREELLPDGSEAGECVAQGVLVDGPVSDGIHLGADDIEAFPEHSAPTVEFGHLVEDRLSL